MPEFNNNNKAMQAVYAALRQRQANLNAQSGRKKGSAALGVEEEEAPELQEASIGVQPQSDGERKVETPERDGAEQDQNNTPLQDSLDKEFREQLFTAYAAQEVSETRQQESDESIAAAKAFVFDTAEITQNSPVTKNHTVHVDAFTSIARTGREEALCFVYEVTGEADMIHQTYTGDPDNEATASVPNNLGPIEFGVLGRESRAIGDYVTEGMVGVAQIAQSRIEEKVMEAGLDMPLAEFPVSLARMQGEVASASVRNLVRTIGREAHRRILEVELIGGEETKELFRANEQYASKFRSGLKATAA